MTAEQARQIRAGITAARWALANQGRARHYGYDPKAWFHVYMPFGRLAKAAYRRTVERGHA